MLFLHQEHYAPILPMVGHNEGRRGYLTLDSLAAAVNCSYRYFLGIGSLSKGSLYYLNELAHRQPGAQG
jgi:hypothetical protein